MKILAINGSPRMERGNTHIMVAEFQKGAVEAGAEFENVFLHGKDIRFCTGCYACWAKTPGKCIHDDDTPEILSKILSSDAIVFACPVYVDNVTGLMKVFMDRLITLGDPHMEKDPQGECRHRKIHLRPTQIIAISNCGFPEQSHFQTLRVLYRRIARNLHCELAAEIYRGAGGLLSAPIPEIQSATERYRALLRQAGSEVVKQGRMSEETKRELEKPLIPMQADADQFIAIVNRMWDDRIAQIGNQK